MKIFKNLMLALMLIFVASSQVLAKASLEDEAKYLPCAEFSGAEKNDCDLVFTLSYLELYDDKYDRGSKDKVLKEWETYKDYNLDNLKSYIDATMSYVSVFNILRPHFSKQEFWSHVTNQKDMTEDELNKQSVEANKKNEPIYMKLIGLHNALLDKTNGKEYLFENKQYTLDDLDLVVKKLNSLKLTNKDVYTILYESNNSYKYTMLAYKDDDAYYSMSKYTKGYAMDSSIYKASLFEASVYKAFLTSVKEVEPEGGLYYKSAEQKLEEVDFVISEINRKIAAK